MRDTRRCSCGHKFTGSEADAEPSLEERRRQNESPSHQRASADPQGTAIRFGIVIVLFVVVQLVAPHIVRPEHMRGGIWAYRAIPGLFLFLWLFFSVAILAAFVMRDGSTISPLVCVIYAFLVAVVTIFLLLPRILPQGSSGPGP